MRGAASFLVELESFQTAPEQQGTLAAKAASVAGGALDAQEASLK